jgi:hypothetical protein
MRVPTLSYRPKRLWHPKNKTFISHSWENTMKTYILSHVSAGESRVAFRGPCDNVSACLTVKSLMGVGSSFLLL